MTLTAVIRTVVAALITWVATLGPVQAFVAWLESIGVPVNWETISVYATIITLAGVTALINWAGRRWPMVARIASLGRSNQSASYEPPGDDMPMAA